MKQKVVDGFFIVALLSSMAFSQLHRIYEPIPHRYYEGVHFAMPQVPLPTIPNVSVSIVEFGAKGDGVTLNTKAFADAIAACEQKGGGRIVVPPGIWVTGPIVLKSNIELHVVRGAIVLFSSNIDDYPMIQRPKSTAFTRSPLLYAVGAHNIAITGEGMFNGNGQYWRPVKKEKLPSGHWKRLIESGGAVTSDGKLWYPSKEALEGEKYLDELRKSKKRLDSTDYAATREFLRPDLLAFVNCSTILIDGPSFVNSPKFTVHPIQCVDVVIRNIEIFNEWWFQNADGIDLSSCRNVVVYNNVINTGDDGICVKPGTPNPKLKDLPACENYIIADNIVYHAHGGFVIGSESYGGARNISVKNLTCVWTDVGLRFKSARDRGGLVEHIVIDSVWMKDIAGEAILFDMSYGDAPTDVPQERIRIPQFRNFTIRNVVCDGARYGVRIEGLREQPIHTISIENATLLSDRSVLMNYAEGIQLNRVALRSKYEPYCTIKNSQQIVFDNVNLLDSVSIFLRVEGSTTKNIRVHKSVLERSQKPFETSNGASESSVVFIH
ncbi:MAG: glycoside hydrolase family 28 protein [Bacteroidetes bacterium]|nr:glycoside hydrolase family 28 protein [Bacteroidota bacterium]